jgi:hypothetical protein
MPNELIIIILGCLIMGIFMYIGDWRRKKQEERQARLNSIRFPRGTIMDKDKIKKLLDEIDKSCQEGWDYNIRSNFYDIMNITGEIEKELK